MFQIFPIVGAYYRPPAQLILDRLHSGTDLCLHPEPENPYDPNAIRVEIDSNNLKTFLHLLYKDDATSNYEDFQSQLLSCGSSIDDLEAIAGSEEPQFLHLGYIPRTENESLLSALAGSPSHSTTFTWTSTGKPAIRVDYGDPT